MNHINKGDLIFWHIRSRGSLRKGFYGIAVGVDDIWTDFQFLDIPADLEGNNRNGRYSFNTEEIPEMLKSRLEILAKAKQ